MEKFDDLSADAGNFGQIFGIGDAGQAGFLVVGTQTGEIVFFFCKETLKILFCFVGEGSFFQKSAQLGFAAGFVDAALVARGASGIVD